MDCLTIKFALLVSLLSALNVDSNIEVTQISVSPNIPYANLSLTSRKYDDGTQFFNNTFTFVHDVLKFKLIVVIKISNDNSSSFDNEIFKSTIDLCKISDGVFGTFAVRWFMETFDNTANFEFKCPFVKDKNYSILNYKLSGSFIPVPKNLNGELTCKYVGKIPSKKVMVHLYTWRAYFINKN